MRTDKPIPGQEVVALIDDLLRRAIARQASDVHFEPQDGPMHVRYRIDGLLQDIDRLPANLAENVIARLKVMAGLLTYRVDIPQEGSLAVPPGLRADSAPLDIRIATFPTIRGERAVVRLLYAGGRVGELDALGLAPAAVNELRRAARLPQGLVLVTGPAGSGKSTTLYALARYILATTSGRSVVSLEDPVEQRVAGMPQIQVSPHGELDYVRAMRSLLRQDVQVLLVGEVRDAETAHIVVEASLTGHLIMSTMHSGDPAEAIVRLLEMGIAPYQVAGALCVVCSQRLLRTVCATCEGRGTSSPDPCGECEGSGYRGRTACGQVAVVDDPLRQAILARSAAGELRRLIDARSVSLLADADRLVNAGRTTREEVRRVLGDS